MAFLLGHGSAVEWLRLNRSIDLAGQRMSLPYASLEGSRRQFQRHAQAALEGLSKPVQLIVWDRGDRRRTAITDCHILNIASGHYPAIRVKRMLFCSTPELAFVQMANLLDEDALLFLGMELCGRFGIDGQIFLRPQTTSPEMLVGQARELPGVHGRTRALTTAPLVVGGAASPMEIALTLILCADRERGGYGLPTPELNRTLLVPDELRTLWDGDHITPDLLWREARLAIEYDSDQHHGTAEQRAHDALRRHVLEELGLSVITVTSQHLLAPRQTERIARTVARRLGITLELGDDDERMRRLGFQARMRHLAAHPDDLLCIPARTRTAQRSWHTRR